MPSWTWDLAGHTVAWDVVIPALVPLGLIFTGAALWPFIERWATGDYREHHVNDRPRNAATRTAIGMGVITFYGILWLEGANDVIADHLDISLYLTTEIARYAIFIGPVVAYWVTKRICLGLQRKDAESLAHGYETGIIEMTPEGEFIERHAPVPEEQRAVLLANKPMAELPAPPDGGDDVPAPATRGVLGKARLAAGRLITEQVPTPTGDGHGNGHGNGHHEPPEPAAVPAGEPGQPALGPGSETDQPEDSGSH
jgi:ubiquinol-cytochrome c reductase cytochrome b subunit